MKGKPGAVRTHLTKLVALGLMAGTFALAMDPAASAMERQQLASRFHFTRLDLPELPGVTYKQVRGVNPNLQRIQSWISSVGAGVALGDLDADGLPNDLCLVDPRTDQVMVTPAPGTPGRYTPFAVEPSPASYDPNVMAPMGCLMADLNEDGLTDLVTYYWGRPPAAFLRTPAKGTPSGSAFVAQDLVEPGQRWYSNAATLADLDGDGHLDLVVGNYFPDGSRILDTNATEPDTMQHSMSRAFNGAGPHFLRWAGGKGGMSPSVAFTPVENVLPEEAAHGWTLAVGAADLDHDLLPEVYVANDFGPDRLLHNRSTPGKIQFAVAEGEATLTTPTSAQLGHDKFKGMGVDFADLNLDGNLDMFVSNIANPYGLVESHFAWINTGETAKLQQGIAPFRDQADPMGLSVSGWGWDAKVADMDNDGVPEVLQTNGFVKGQVNRWADLQELATGNDELLKYSAVWPKLQPGTDLSGRTNHNPFFVLGEGNRYVDIAPDLGLKEPNVSRGIAVADVDGDGRLDFAVANQWSASSFYHNDCTGCGRSLGLHLRLPLKSGEASTVRPGHPVGELAGRPAIGATVKVTLPNGRQLIGQVDGGNGHSGKRSPDLFFGLGQLAPDQPIQVEVSWRNPDGKPQHETFTVKPGWNTIVLGW